MVQAGACASFVAPAAAGFDVLAIRRVRSLTEVFMSTLTLTEVLEAKRETEAAISAALAKFQGLTGLHAQGLSVSSHYTIGGLPHPIVELAVRLP